MINPLGNIVSSPAQTIPGLPPPIPRGPAPGQVDRFQAPRPADDFREMARLRLQAMQTTPPTESLVEMTALTMAEQKLTIPGFQATPLVSQGQGILKETLYVQRLVASGLGAPGPLGPVLANILADLDTNKILGPSNHAGTLHWRNPDLKNVATANRAAGLEVKLPSSNILLTGALSPHEVHAMDSAVQGLISKVGSAKVTGLLHELHLSTLLGQIEDEQGRITNGISGLGGLGELAIERQATRSPGALSYFLGHEFGHVLDHDLARGTGLKDRSQGLDTPFGKTKDRADYVTDYATHNNAEDFADTNAHLLGCWKQAHDQPQVFVHARGEVGKKMAWILEHGYGESIPPIHPGVTNMLSAVEQGRSPFGYFDRNGALQGAKPAYQKQLHELHQHFNEDGTFNMSYLDKNHPQAYQRQWIYDRLFTDTPMPVLKPPSVNGVVNDLNTIFNCDNALRSNKKDDQARATKASCGTRILGRFAMAPGLKEEVKAYFDSTAVSRSNPEYYRTFERLASA